MNKFYVRDGRNIKYFDSTQEVVSFLEKVVELKLKSNRKEWMQHVIDLGHGYDDSLGKTFVESMSSHVEIGTVKKDGKHLRCNIFEATTFSDPAFGD